MFQVTKGNNDSLQSDAIFEEMARQIKSRSDLTAKISAIFFWNITKNGKVANTWSEFCFRQLL